MSRNGSGTYSRAVPPYVNGTTADATVVNTEMNDIAAALTQSLSKDGQTTPTADLPMGGNRHTGVDNAVARTDYAATGQVQDSAFHWGGTAGGTANALTLSLSPAILAYAAGQKFWFKSGANANTAATTVAVSGLATMAIQNNGAALVGGEIAADQWYEITYDGAAFQLQRIGVSPPGPFVDTSPIVVGSADATKKLRVEVDGLTTATTRVWTAQDRNITVANILDTHGRCRLAKVSNDLVLSPLNGNTIVINSAIAIIPDAGASLAPSGLGAGTVYYIYAYLNSGTMTLEASTTAYAVQAGTGVYIKNGDATRTLVGMERATGATTWEGLVRSWFNDPGFTAIGAFTANRTNSSASYAEVNSEIRTGFLVWTGEIATLNAQGCYSNSGTGTYFSSLTIDGVTTSNAYNAGAFSAGSQEIGFGLTRFASGLTEGYHYATLANKVSSGTITYRGGAADTNERCTIAVMVKR